MNEYYQSGPVEFNENPLKDEINKLPERIIYNRKIVNSVKFRENYHKIKHTSSFRIIFQRFFLVRWVTLLYNYLYPNETIFKSDDDVIIITKRKHLTEKSMKAEIQKYKNFEENKGNKEENKEKNKEIEEEKNKENKEEKIEENKEKLKSSELDIESGADFGDIDDLDDFQNVTDEEFIKSCRTASKICLRYSKIFRVFEVFCKISEAIFVGFLPLSNFLFIHEHIIVIIICVCGPFFIFRFTCEFSKLEDKYAALCSRFWKLSESKSDDRYEKYNKLVRSFRNNWVYSDFIKYNIVDYETQYNVDIE